MQNIIESIIFIFSMSLIGTYIIVCLIAVKSILNYLTQNRLVDYRKILSSPLAPSVSLLAPAYNEGVTIVDNVRSLLGIQYSKLEIIVINDGSKDNSLEVLVKAFDLEEVPNTIIPKIATKEIRGIYKPKNPALKKLTVVDKVNGGKSDALNVGINVAQSDLVACIDCDCILAPDAILKMVKPFLEHSEEKVVAAGGVIRVANSCKIVNGQLAEINMPKNMLARIQTLEYIRSFLLSRMGWAHMNGLLIISGAFGLFDRAVVLEVGGYDHETVGEDMELVVRIHRTMLEKKIPYKVKYIPDPLCWTEVPSTLDIFLRQRNRWTRGNMETLLKHRKMMFNPTYKVLGLLSYPYWVLFEWFAPLIEVVGLIFLVILVILGNIDWASFALIMMVLYTFGIFYSLIAILFEELTYHQYRSKRAILKLLVAALVEPVIYHPLVLWSAIKGNIDFLTGKKSWGKMTRTGFSKES